MTSLLLRILGPPSCSLLREARWQKFMLQCQLFMESQGYKYIESIEKSFYNIPPLLRSLYFALISPAAKIAFIYTKNFPVPFAIKILFNTAIKRMTDRH